jgi:hypothetical protein
MLKTTFENKRVIPPQADEAADTATAFADNCHLIAVAGLKRWLDLDAWTPEAGCGSTAYHGGSKAFRAHLVEYRRQLFNTLTVEQAAKEADEILSACIPGHGPWQPSETLPRPEKLTALDSWWRRQEPKPAEPANIVGKYGGDR